MRVLFFSGYLWLKPAILMLFYQCLRNLPKQVGRVVFFPYQVNQNLLGGSQSVCEMNAC